MVNKIVGSNCWLPGRVIAKEMTFHSSVLSDSRVIIAAEWRRVGPGSGVQAGRTSARSMGVPASSTWGRAWEGWALYLRRPAAWCWGRGNSISYKRSGADNTAWGSGGFTGRGWDRSFRSFSCSNFCNTKLRLFPKPRLSLEAPPFSRSSAFSQSPAFPQKLCLSSPGCRGLRNCHRDFPLDIHLGFGPCSKDFKYRRLKKFKDY